MHIGDQIQIPFQSVKALSGFFLCVFSSLTCLKKHVFNNGCFQQWGSSAVEGTSQAVLGSSNQLKVPTSLPLFLKSEKIPALLSLGKGPKYRPLRVLGTDLKSQKGLYSGPSPIQRIFICWIL
jgi:hypothetical protein